MNQIKLLRSTTFRFAIIYLILFGLSVMALLSFFYWTTAGISTSQTDDTIQAEITGLAEQYRANGLVGLTRIVRERSQNQRQSLYLLTDPTRRQIAGNIDAWPDTATGAEGWLEFPYQRPVGGQIETHQARARHFLLAGGFQLLVGRDVQPRVELEQVMRGSLAWSLALTLGLGLIGGVLMSRNMLRRIEAINRTSREIMAGALSERVPLSGSGDELDQLAQNLNAMLAQIERLVTGMRQVTDNIAHDLRSPLNRLRSRLEVTLLAPPDEAAYRQALEETIDESERLLGTFNALLNIAQAESGQAFTDIKPIDLGAIAATAAELYEPLAEEKGLAFVADTDAGLTIDGNEHLLSQAIANMLDNAIKYTPAGGAVTISARWVGGDFELAIADTGAGIPADQRDKVLDRFVRLEQSRSSPGSGLGLSLVQAVAQLHQAELALVDNSPGLRVVLKFSPSSA